MPEHTRCITHSLTLCFQGLAAGLGVGAASEAVRRATLGAADNGTSVFMSEGNIRRLVDKLSRMRGAALKLGQFLSIQGEHFYSWRRYVYCLMSIDLLCLRLENAARSD